MATLSINEVESVIEVARKIATAVKGHKNCDVIPSLIAHIGRRFESCTSIERRYALNLIMEMFTELTYKDIHTRNFTVPKH